MSILMEEKPLIEWEKELDVWLVDVLPSEHFMVYSKMDAFAKMGIGNIKRGWGYNENNIYSNYKSNGSLDNMINSNDNDLIIKPLIEWERELGYWIYSFNKCDHLKKCSRREALKLINSNCFISSWNNDADLLYEECYKKPSYVYVNNYTMDISKTESVPKGTTGSHNIFSRFVNKVNDTVSSSIVKMRKPKNKQKVRYGVMKAAISFAVSLVTVISAGSLSTIKTTSCDSSVMNENSTFDNESSIVSSYTIKNNSTEEVLTCNSVNQNDDYVDSVNLGDAVTLREGSYVYGSIYNAIDRNNGLNTYYSYDTKRTIAYVALNYNDEIIYSNSISEIEYYKNRGALVVSVCTSINNELEGYYNSNDIVKVKVKKK